MKNTIGILDCINREEKLTTETSLNGELIMADIASISLLLQKTDIDTIEEHCLSEKQADCPVVHHFSPGICIREVFVPAGTFAIGHIQKKEHLNIFLRGKVTVYDDDGSFRTLTAPMIFTSKPGRKVGYVLEDMVWLNVYVTDEKDVDCVEEEFLDKSDISIEKYKELIPDNASRLDYINVLKESGYTEEQVQEEVLNEADQTQFSQCSVSVKVDISPIHGKGIFSTAPFDVGDLICEMRIDGRRTPAGRFTNHSKTPNAKPIIADNNVWLVALNKISGCSGGFNGDEITIDYREALKIRRLL